MEMMNFNPFAVASKPNNQYDINWAYERYEELLEEQAIRQVKPDPIKLLTDKRYADAGDDSFF